MRKLLALPNPSPFRHAGMLFVSLFLATFAAGPLSGDVKLFILAGTSNMLGHGTEADLEPFWQAAQEDVWIWQDDLNGNVGFASLEPGYGATSTNWGAGGNGDRCTQGIIASGRCGTLEFGPELTLGRQLADAYPDHQIAFVKHARPGALAMEWHPDDTGLAGQQQNYVALASKVQDSTQSLSDVGLEFEVAGLFWDGGADARNPEEALTYERNLRQLIASVREDFANDPNMPFVIGRSHIGISVRPNRPHWEIVRAAQVAVAEEDPFGAWADGDDLPTKAFDDPHYNATGQLGIGRRMANAYQRIADADPLLFCNSDSMGDLDGNGQVDFADFLTLSTNFGQPAIDHTTGDIDCNGTVEFEDFVVLTRNFGNSTSQTPVVVPEPVTLSLVLPALSFLALTRPFATRGKSLSRLNG